MRRRRYIPALNIALEQIFRFINRRYHMISKGEDPGGAPSVRMQLNPQAELVRGGFVNSYCWVRKRECCTITTVNNGASSPISATVISNQPSSL